MVEELAGIEELNLEQALEELRDSSWEQPEYLYELRDQRVRLWKQHPELISEISRILFFTDPMYISYWTDEDEYEAEAGTIVTRLRSAHNVDAVEQIVLEEFAWWFNEQVVELRMDPAYRRAAERIWEAWNDYPRASEVDEEPVVR